MSILNVDKIQPIGSGSTVTVNATDTILTNAQAGVITATRFDGIISATTDDWITHQSDSNTRIGFPAADTFSVETAGQQNVQVTADRTRLTSPSGTNTTVRLQHQGNSGYGDIILDRTVNAFIIDNDPGNAGSNGTYFSVKTIGSERLRITSGGQLNLAGNMQFTAADPELEFNNGGPRFRVPSANTLTVHTGGGLGATSNERLRIVSNGHLLFGNRINDRNAWLQFEGTDHYAIGLHRNSADHGAPAMRFSASRGTTAGANTIVQNNDYLGMIRFEGTDGSDLATGAYITSQVDGTPGSNDMPARLGFWTSADGSQSPTERLRITSSGDIQSLNSVQSGGNATSGFKIGAIDTAAYIGVQGKSASNGGAAGNAVFQGWFGASNTFRVNCDGLIKTSKGVDFSGAQTNTGGMTSETLDAYEEGTFTPAFGGLSSVSYSIQFGRYTRIGRQVFCTATIDATGIDEASNITLTGLPYSATETGDDSQRSTWLLAYGGHITGVSDATARFRSAGSSWQGVKGTASTSYLTGQQLSSSGTINITGSFSYYIA